MTARNPTIIATSIGFQAAGHGEMDWRLGPAYGLAASLARASDSPRVCIAQDVIWVAGGSVANLLALWRLHGVGPAMHTAWQAGVVLMGVSAGSVCWFTGGTTDSFGLPLRPVTDGLGFLPYSNSPHHDAEEQRRPTIHKLISDGTLPDGYASDNGTGLIFEGTELTDCISDTEGGRTWQISRQTDGTISEVPLPTRLLPA
ncbi:MAG TPA: peptidase E [Streptosporangiaceae bacterium]|jgi:peptidase E